MWLTGVPAPVSESAAVVAGFWLTTVSVAAAAPAPAGANCTVTLQDLPGFRLVPLQVSAETMNAADPGRVTFRALLADPPLLASVNTCVAVLPTLTCP